MTLCAPEKIIGEEINVLLAVKELHSQKLAKYKQYAVFYQVLVRV